ATRTAPTVLLNLDIRVLLSPFLCRAPPSGLGNTPTTWGGDDWCRCAPPVLGTELGRAARLARRRSSHSQTNRKPRRRQAPGRARRRANRRYPTHRAAATARDGDAPQHRPC